MDFTNKVVLVTGSSRGIGQACAIQFAKAGAKVAVHYNRNLQSAEETIGMMEGDGHIIVGADMADADAVKTMVDTVVEKMGRIDILVNNAGIFVEHKIAEVDYATWQEKWRETIDVNLIGAANACYCAAQYMIKQGGGRIVNVSSRGAFRGEPNAPAYGASKAAMNSMGQSLAKALAPHNIYVATVAPGWVMTDMAADHLSDDIKAQSPLNRIATPDEIAHAVLFFASEGAEFATGAILDVNGASYLRT
ncbi:MAG: SDR family oxidoreductase [Anaerolineae bacterium]|nr:SDR family oxidoreductase [Anaerolineae bacterium]